MNGARRISRLRPIGAGLGIVAVVLLVVLPVDSPAWVVVSMGAEAVAVVVFLIAALRMPARARLVWWALWAYAALTFAADVLYDVLLYHFGVSPFPSVADALYLLAYAPQIAALVVLVRQRQGVWDRQAWIDAAVITVAAVSVAATFVLLPMMSESSPREASDLIALAYPLLDLVVLALLIRLTVGGGRPPNALVLLTASVAVTLVADLAYNGLAVAGTETQAEGWLQALFTGGVLLLAAAATDSGAGSMGVPSGQDTAMMSTPRTVAVGIAALTAPVLLAVGTRDNSSPQVFFLALAAIFVNLLVIWRILLLLRTVQRQADRLDLLARTDSLTHLPNRRSWDFELLRAVTAADETGTPLTVAMADIDHFKDYNDRHGHPAGDALLAECARLWRAELDPSAFLARYGGEEFAIILTGVLSDDAATVLDRLRRATPPPVTLSVGYARHDRDDPITVAMDQADRLLYAAKQAGRDRVHGPTTRANAV